jgi:hypothetical protein
MPKTLFFSSLFFTTAPGAKRAPDHVTKQVLMSAGVVLSLTNRTGPATL